MIAVEGFVPAENLRCYERLFCIEVALRELIVMRLSQAHGPLWYKTRLPVEILRKYRDAVATERAIKWLQLVPHHPIYYIDFTDLQQIIEKDDNWRDVFRDIFGRKDIVAGILAEIAPIRNKVAHSRKVSP